MKAHAKHRFLCLLLTVLMLVSLFPTAALAADTGTGTTEAVLVKSLDQLKDGDQIVVYNPAHQKAMSETDVSTYYRAGVDATVADGKLSGYEESAVWTLGVKTDAEGKTTYTFTSATGRVLTAGTRNSLPMDDANPDWTIEPATTEGCFYIRNAGRDTQYVEWYADRNEFSAYKYAEANEAIYAMQLYRVVPPVQEGFVTDLSTLEDGAKIVVYNPAHQKAMSETDVASYYRAGVDATVSDGKLSGYDESAVWTLGVKTDAEGKTTYTFTSATNRVLTAGTRNSLPMDDANPDWTIEPAATEGCFYIRNAGRDTQYVEWYADRNEFSAYKYAEANEAIYAMQLYRVTDTPEEPSPSPSTEPSPEPTSVPANFAVLTSPDQLKDGDQIVVYNPAHQKAMSETDVASYYRAGVDATVADGKLSGYDESAVWTLGVKTDAEGKTTYTFTSATGRVLTAGTRNSLPMDDANPDWTIEPAATEGCFYIRNAGRDTQYVEWYADRNEFSAYKYAEANEAIYAMQLYRVVPPVQEGFVTDLSTLEDGAKVVVYNPAHQKAMSETDVASYYRAGVDATVADGKLSGYDESAVWTLGVKTDADGKTTYTFTSATGRVLTAGTRNSLPMDDANPDWTIEPAATEGCFYIRNAGRDTQYVEWYADRNEFSAYKYAEANEAIYAMQLYRVVKSDTPDDPQPGTSGAIANLSELTDGSTVLIYSPTHKTAASSKPNGDWYLKAVPTTITDGKVESFTGDLVWTVHVTDGVYTFSNGEHILTAWYSSSEKDGKVTEYAEISVDGVKYPDTGWNISVANAENRTFYVKNATVSGSYGPAYLEAYTKNGAEQFSGYFTNKPSERDYGLQFWPVNPADAEPEQGIEHDGVLQAGDKVVIYNAQANGAFGLDNTGLNASLGSIPTDIRDGMAYPANGAYVFHVGIENGYYTFSAGGKYLATNNAEELFLQAEKTATAMWYLKPNGSGYTIYNKEANYNGTPVCIEFYSGAFSGWTFKSNDPAIFAMEFYPVHSTITTLDDVTNVPSIVFDTEDAPVKQQAYTVKFTLDDLTPLEQLTVNVTLNGEPVTNLQNDGKNFSFIVPAEVTAVESALNIDVQVTNAAGGSYSLAVTMLVQDIPVFSNFKPEPGSETGDNKMPLISADVKNVSDRDSAVITIAGKTYPAQIQNGVVSYQPTEPLKDGRTTVRVEVTRQDGAAGEASWSFVVGTATTQLYFGQLHSHTTYSDGSGSLPTALEYVKNLPESANVQFVAFTDHSNYFDSNSAANPEGALYDMSLATPTSQELWKNYRKTVADFNASQTDVIAIAGFEMTWSGGPGHINTFNSPGIVSRNNATLNQKTNDAGMKSYYALLSQPEGAETLSQFNHPGKTFGNFTDFSYWDAVTDSRIFLVEVGNGEGQIGAGGYYPSYEQYIMALDKGWHVAPTNNQDNHKGRWGNANDARDVILTDDFTEEGIYQAIRDMRVYATEDKNLEVYYTVNEKPLGSSLSEVPEQLNVNVQVNDPDSGDRISKVEVVVNSGKVVHTWDDASALAAGTLTVTLAPNYSYYFIRVTEADGDLAVTAPVWVGETLKLGISAFESETAMPVTGEELTLKTTLYNSEGKEATIKNITYTTSGSKVLGVDTNAYTVPASGTLEIPFKYTPDVAKVMTITVTVVMEQDGKEFTFTKDLTLDVQNADELVYIGIDASHHNEYVAGNYKDSMGNFANLAAEHAVRTVYLKTSDELIAACGNDKYKAIILTAPSRRDGSSLRNPYENYTDAEIAAIVDFNAKGGTVVLTGWSDYYEHYAEFPAADHMAAQQNRILEALGSSLRIADDGTNDDVLNGGQSPRLYFDTFNMDNPLMAGVVVDPEHPNDRAYSEVFSHYGGASIYAVDGSGAPSGTLPDTVCPAVYAHATTYSADSDNDGLGGAAVPKYPVAEGDNRLLVMATEELPGKGMIVVSGAAFLSNFEVQAQISDGSSDADTQKNYSNYKVCENLVSPMNAAKVSDISAVRAQTEEGFKYTIEGVVTSNASGYDKDTAFFDCIYVQDETGGICCFPVSGTFKVGDKVRVTGTTDFYQGEPELQVTNIVVIGTGEVAPKEVSAKDVTSRAVEGSLITVKGTVESFEVVNGLVQTIMVKDAKGDVVRVFIDGYITTANEVKDLTNGCSITVTGLASYDDTFNAPEGPFPRIRIRDRADVICTPKAPEKCDGGANCPSKAFTDVDRGPDSWYHEAVDWATVKGVTNGTSKTTFSPDNACTRAQAVTMLYRAKGEPAVKATKCDFVDVPTNAYFYKAVLWAVENGITNGVDAKHFNPDDICTRAHIVTFLQRAEKGTAGTANPFVDVPAGQWYTDAVLWANAKGITNGVDPTHFAPMSDCTRAHIVTFLYRAMA